MLFTTRQATQILFRQPRYSKYHNKMNQAQQSSLSESSNSPALPRPEPIKKGTRRYSYSLPGQRLTQAAGSLKRRFRNIESFFVQEIIAVAVWSATVSLFSLLIQRLIEKANELDRLQEQGDVRAIFAGIAWLFLRLTPSKLRAGGSVPGFILAHPWVLLRMEEYFDMIPNLACRVCEWRLGRIPIRALLLSFVIHSIVPCFIWGFLELLSTECPLNPSIHSLQYTNEGNTASYFLKEVFASAIFPVAILVFPTLLKVNNLPDWLIMFCVFPLYTLGVDDNEKGSSLSFGALVAQCLLDWQFHELRWRIFAQMIGSSIAGMVMFRVFPDEPRA